jgi:hypothetical protein
MKPKSSIAHLLVMVPNVRCVTKGSGPALDPQVSGMAVVSIGSAKRLPANGKMCNEQSLGGNSQDVRLS